MQIPNRQSQSRKPRRTITKQHVYGGGGVGGGGGCVVGHFGLYEWMQLQLQLLCTAHYKGGGVVGLLPDSPWVTEQESRGFTSQVTTSTRPSYVEVERMNERNSIIIGQPETLDNDLSLSNSPHREITDPRLLRTYYETKPDRGVSLTILSPPGLI